MIPMVSFVREEWVQQQTCTSNPDISMIYPKQSFSNWKQGIRI